MHDWPSQRVPQVIEREASAVAEQEAAGGRANEGAETAGILNQLTSLKALFRGI